MKKTQMALAASLIALSSSASAASFIVNANTTLVQAAAAANASVGADIITFDASFASSLSNGIYNTPQPIGIQGDVTIDGGSNNIIIKGAAGHPIFNLLSSSSNPVNVEFNLKNLGLEGTGSALALVKGIPPTNSASLTSLAMDKVKASNPAGRIILGSYIRTISILNSDLSSSGTSGDGGALYTISSYSYQLPYSTTDITVKNSTFNNNTIQLPAYPRNGAAIYIVPAQPMNLLIENSSFSNNSADGNGGAIYLNIAGTGVSDVKLRNNTFVNNTAGNGGAIHATGNSSSTFLIENSIIAGNSSNPAEDIYTSGFNTTVSYSLIKDSNDLSNLTDTLKPSGASSNIFGQGAGTAPTAVTSHPILGGYYELHPASPAVNSGIQLSSSPSTDLIGTSRSSGCNPDMGAIERAFTSPSLLLPDLSSFSIEDTQAVQTFNLSVFFNDPTSLTYSATTTASTQSFDVNASTGLLSVEFNNTQLQNGQTVEVVISAENTNCMPATTTLTMSKNVEGSVSGSATQTSGSSSSSSSSSGGAFGPLLMMLMSAFAMIRRRRA